jgi:hypothetical protein
MTQFKYDQIPPNMSIIGTCSICSGPVIVPTIWYGVVPPIGTCNTCGATEAKPEDFGPIIPMNPPKRGYKWTLNTTSKYDPDHYSDSWMLH